MFPERIICLTEETVEILYLLGQQDKIIGISNYVKRPAEAAKQKEKVSVFTHANINKIVKLKPDLVIGFSDIQKDVAKQLIAEGLNVLVTNQRSIDEILSNIEFIGRIVGCQDDTGVLVKKLKSKVKSCRESFGTTFVKPKVYFEEWDDPLIYGIKWVSELIELCGGIDICKPLGQNSLAKGRIIKPDWVVEQNPDIILASWCGKKVSTDEILRRKNWNKINACKHDMVFELEPEIFLQPGPAPLLEGIDILINLFEKWAVANGPQ